MEDDGKQTNDEIHLNDEDDSDTTAGVEDS